MMGGSRSRVDRLLLVVVTAGGVGYAPVAPGSAGSLLALLLGWGLGAWGAGSTLLAALACAALTALLAGLYTNVLLQTVSHLLAGRGGLP